ncbi:MAG TPA: hypothetical protein DIW31_09905 [Bacteroidales bacterium]|nr:hypothetical protein [Bacteroidales bacterium]
MNQQEVKSIIESAIEASTATELALLSAKIPSKYHMSPIKYPALKFELSAEELNTINVTSEAAQREDFSSRLQNQLKTPLEKLFYSVLWKQGDLSKLTHILQGIENLNVEPTKKAGIVFRTFGEYLRDKSIPILDQHCMRAYGVYQARNDSEVRKFLKLEVLLDTEETRKLVLDYHKFFRKAVEGKEANFPFYFDRLLVTLGRYIKR